jgi:drug/metabolite transporter (DMT)-like permease
VNPVVAVLLGWAVAGEPFTPRMAIAAAIILGAVALITLANTRRTSPTASAHPPSPRAPRAAPASR